MQTKKGADGEHEEGEGRHIGEDGEHEEGEVREKDEDFFMRRKEVDLDR